MNIDLEKLWLTFVTGAMAGIAWLVRRVFTNEKQIAVMKESLQHQQATMDEIKKDVKQLVKDK